MSDESPILPPAHKAGKRVSVALAIAVHLLLAGFLFYGVRWQTKVGEAVEVELVRAVPPVVVAAPPEPVAVPPAPTIEPPPTPKPKPAPPPAKPDIAIKEKDKPKPPPKVEPARPRIDPAQELLKRETEQLTQRKQVESAAQELAQLKAAQVAAARNKAISDYVSSIRRKIRGKIFVPPDVKGNPEAVFDVTQLPSGEIVTVRLKHSSGHAALDEAIARAIHASNPLPKPEPADLFSRSLELRFKPLDD